MAVYSLFLPIGSLLLLHDARKHFNTIRYVLAAPDDRLPPARHAIARVHYFFWSPANRRICAGELIDTCIADITYFI